MLLGVALYSLATPMTATSSSIVDRTFCLLVLYHWHWYRRRVGRRHVASMSGLLKLTGKLTPIQGRFIMQAREHFLVTDSTAARGGEAKAWLANYC
jgi:hypothetical protein